MTTANLLNDRPEKEIVRDMTPIFSPSSTEPIGDTETLRLLNELRVKQIELEIQNEELRISRAQVQAQKERYADFYDFSPSGFVSLLSTGAITQINRAGAQLVGKTSADLVGQRFEAFVVAADRPAFNACLTRMFAARVKQSCEVVLSVRGRAPLVIRMEAAVSPDGQECRAVLVDITAMQQSQRDLLASRAFSKSTIDAVSEQIVVLDQSGTIVAVNKAWCDFYDKNSPQTARTNYYIGTSYLDVCDATTGPHTGEAAQMSQGIRKVLRGEQELFTMEYPCHAPNDQSWFAARVTRFPDGSGKVVVSHGNISARMRAEAQLQSSHDLLAKLTRHLPGMIFQFKMFPDGRSCFPYASDGVRDLCGVSAHELFEDSAPLFANLHADDSQVLADSIQESVRTLQPWVLDYRVTLPKEAPRWHSGVAIPERLGDGSTLWHGFIHDTTAEREVRDTLRDSEEKFRLQSLRLSEVIWGTNSGTWEWNLPTGETVINERWASMVGYTLAELGPSNPAVWEKLVHPDDARISADQLAHCFSHENNIYACEFRLRHKNGEWVWVHARGRVVEWKSDGTPLRMSGTHLDITSRKVAETKLAQHSVALQLAKNEAEQANNAKSRFLAAASHDLRQPLAAMSLYVEVLKMKPPDDKLLANMSNCVSSLGELLTDLLDISKLDAGVVMPVVSDFSVSKMLVTLFAAHAPQAFEKGLQLRCPPTTLYARTDRVWLSRILGNLLANAIRYTWRGGVLVRCRQHQGRAWIEIWDSGIGIAPEKTSEIFEEYRQLERDERSLGSGLGLAIVAKSASLLGLQMRVKSRVGRGSMFAVELPPGTSTRVVERRDHRRRPLRIALVDDNAILLDALGSALRSKGNQVVAAGTGLELLAKLGDAPPDMIISDYRLAYGETGFDVIAAARKVFGEDLPALLITGDTDPKLLRSMAAKDIALRHKPLKFDALLGAIAHAVKQRGPSKRSVDAR